MLRIEDIESMALHVIADNQKSLDPDDENSIPIYAMAFNDGVLALAKALEDKVNPVARLLEDINDKG